MKMYRISLDGDSGPIVDHKALGIVVEAEADSMEEGSKMQIETVEISQADYDRLPEFNGWEQISLEK